MATRDVASARQEPHTGRARQHDRLLDLESGASGRGDSVCSGMRLRRPGGEGRPERPRSMISVVHDVYSYLSDQNGPRLPLPKPLKVLRHFP
jgi:hypothetical protein